MTEVFQQEQRFYGFKCVDVLLLSRYCLFVAYPQWGKTGLYHFVAKMMLQKGYVDNVVIFSGNRDTELRSQTISRVEDKKKKIKVCWGQDLVYYKKPPKGTKTLYIWDESHYGQSKSQCVDQFMYRCGITPSEISNTENYLFSISATPFSEIYNIPLQNIVRVSYTCDYWSVQHMLLSSQIKFYDSYSSYMLPYSKKTRGYVLVRVSNTGKYKKHDELVRYCKSNDIDVILFDQEHCDSIDELLHIKPKKLTYILVKNRLQMGKTLSCQSHIIACVETSINKNTDSLIQGFIGRMSGYNTNTNTHIYIPSNSKKDIYKYVQLMTNKEFNYPEMKLPSPRDYISFILKNELNNNKKIMKYYLSAVDGNINHRYRVTEMIYENCDQINKKYIPSKGKNLLKDKTSGNELFC